MHDKVLSRINIWISTNQCLFMQATKISHQHVGLWGHGQVNVLQAEASVELKLVDTDQFRVLEKLCEFVKTTTNGYRIFARKLLMRRPTMMSSEIWRRDRSFCSNFLKFSYQCFQPLYQCVLFIVIILYLNYYIVNYKHCFSIIYDSIVSLIS